MNNEIDVENITVQSDLVRIRNAADLRSNNYQRAKDKIRDIQLDTNNAQTAGLKDFITQYKDQTDKTNKLLLFLTIVTVVTGLLSVAFQIIDLVNSNPKIEIIKIDNGSNRR